MAAVYTGETIRLVDLITDQAPGPAFIRDVLFTDCTINGPAVVLPLRSVEFRECSWDGTMKSLCWEIKRGRDYVTGAIALESTVFERCSFVGIGLAGDYAFLEQFKRGVHGTAT